MLALTEMEQDVSRAVGCSAGEAGRGLTGSAFTSSRLGLSSDSAASSSLDHWLAVAH